jgi:pyrimidine operon attenuation protein/uracil phosphoribosyltransferase
MHDHLILNSKQIHQKIKRLAVEVLEHHVQSNGLIIIGIKGNGSVLAKHLAH